MSRTGVTRFEGAVETAKSGFGRVASFDRDAAPR
jgi:hypothetical protein